MWTMGGGWRVEEGVYVLLCVVTKGRLGISNTKNKVQNNSKFQIVLIRYFQTNFDHRKEKNAAISQQEERKRHRTQVKVLMLPCGINSRNPQVSINRYLV